MKKLGLIAIICLGLVSCTDNSRARTWGGTETINLDPGVRLVNITWKGGEKTTTSLWILTKKDTTKPTTYSFKEKSSLGLMEGEVIIKEQ
jgi:hypothetical protein